MSYATAAAEFWRGRRVLVTGHTGFKGAWLSLWLAELGAAVTGYALDPPTEPSLFVDARVGESIDSVIGDVRDRVLLAEIVARARPQIVFHLAAQSLVRRSYREPVETYETNVIGTVNVLEAVRAISGVDACVIITSDKCYENREWVWGYRETDPMGGHDPYSSSKGCAELVTAAWRNAYFSTPGAVALASARAGNVVGGGDWSEDRLVPDIVRAFCRGAPAGIRNPAAVRPWQHVFEPLRGYLMLAERMCGDRAQFAEGWNFGPEDADIREVGDVARVLARQWPDGALEVAAAPAGPHEAHLLRLDCSKARVQLGWRSCWPLDRGLEETVAWYRAHAAGADMRAYSMAQLRRYREDAGAAR